MMYGAAKQVWKRNVTWFSECRTSDTDTDMCWVILFSVERGGETINELPVDLVR